MINHNLIETGSWVDAIGQITSAVGATQQITNSEDFYQGLIVIGDGLQSVGNALQGLGETDPLGAKGDWIQVVGAGTASVGAALQLDRDNAEGMRLGILGNSLQALGAALSSVAEEDHILVIASKLQSVGAVLNAIGTVKQLYGLKKKD
ncbi:hypothetical protein J2S00_002100 [Caldalkalibacillus uzonensis]|uniref:Uncharacterized protein n=1 Tax=Caldalkalibacillus uzonensis TaxID=353224 RepID=A0ABU0CSA8_9BACI|nr:hypothetical protein [Caldalkalibacillus uzonensis]MDQ0339313.1 hypothetical protein [Caldalkalibacillus uzonensis]